MENIQEMPLNFNRFYQLPLMNEFSRAYVGVGLWLSTTSMSQNELVSTLLIMLTDVLPSMNTMTLLKIKYFSG